MKIENESLKEYLERKIEEYRPLFFLEGYNIKVRRTEQTDFNYTFEIDVKYPYRAAVLLYGERAEKRFSNSENLDQFILHELSHILVAELSQTAQDHAPNIAEQLANQDEKLTDWIAFIVHNLLTKDK